MPGQMSIFDFMDEAGREKPELHSIIYWVSSNKVHRGIVISQSYDKDPRCIVVSGTGNITWYLPNWYSSRAEAEAHLMGGIK